MTPEYKFRVEGLVAKEQVVSGLFESGYILSVKKRFDNTYEITVYGKERVDGKGGKATDWMEKHGKVGGNGIIDTPSVTSTTKLPNTTPIPWVTSTGSGSITTAVDAISTITNNTPYTPKKDETFWIDSVTCCDPGFLIETPEQKQRNKEIIKNAIDKGFGC